MKEIVVARPEIQAVSVPTTPICYVTSSKEMQDCIVSALPGTIISVADGTYDGGFVLSSATSNITITGNTFGGGASTSAYLSSSTGSATTPAIDYRRLSTGTLPPLDTRVTGKRK